MLVTNRQVYIAGQPDETGISPLDRLARLRIPMRESIALARTLRNLREAWQDLETARLQMVRRYAGVEADLPCQVPMERTAEFLSEWNQAMDQSLTLLEVEPMALSGILCDGNLIEPATLMAVDWLFVSETPPSLPRAERRRRAKAQAKNAAKKS